MKGRAIIPLAVGLAIGVFAIKYFVSVVKKAKGASADVVQVICANSDIAPTSEIKEAMLETKTLPKALAPKMFMSDRKEVIGRVSGQQIVTGMPIVSSLLAPKGTPPGLTVRIPDGFRAMAVQVDESTGVAGWLKPGSRVDVIAVMSSRDGGQNQDISKVILQNVEVLASGQDIGTKTDAAASLPKTVTLAVGRDDLAKLQLATTKGKIRLAMRNQLDSDTSRKLVQTSDNDLLADPAKKQSTAGSLLAGFLSNLPKRDEQATDKTARAQKPDPVEPVVAAAPKVTAPRDWVQVYVGSEFREELGFSRDSSGWRLVAAKGKDSLHDSKGNLQDFGPAAPGPAKPGLPSPFLEH